MTGTLIDTLERKILEWMGQLDLPGLSVALVEDNALVWSRGFGVANRQTARPVTPDTVFEAASLSKPVFAYGVLKLYETGLLDLDIPLSAYLPEPYLPGEPRLPLITARRVLCHTPGLPNWRPKGEPLVMHLTPGERFSYSGEGYVYLQKVVEHLTGRALDDLMQAHVLELLGMSSSSFVWRDEYEDRAAQGHDETGSPVDKWRSVEANVAYSLRTTPSDFARLLMAIMQPPAASDFQPSPALIAEMLRPHVPVNDLAPWHPDWPNPPIAIQRQVSWGLGWGLQHGPGGDAFWHWGDNGPCQAFAMAVPSQNLGLVSMANSELAHGLWAPLYGEVFGGEQPAITWLNHLYSQR